MSSSNVYNLDDSTLLEESAILDGASIVQDRKASGSGKNTISQSVAGNGYSITSSLVNSGLFDAQTSVAATSNEASYVQNILGESETQVKQIIYN